MCGIFGIINTSPKKFDYRTFCTLGINNDTRGGDSCGVFIDGNVEYGVDKEKLFSSFMLKSKLINRAKKVKIALGHCRKASVGTISEKTAQPVVIYNQNGELDYMLMHNGTIYNYKELAAKYIPNVDINGMTDSQVMARIFYYAGYDALSEYYGGAVFFIIDYRSKDPKIMVFKGSSKYTEHSTASTEERPFYFANDKDGNFYFSSISSFLYTIENGIEVYTITPNELIKLNNRNELIRIKAYNRDSVIQTKPTSLYGQQYMFKDFDDYYGYPSYSNYYKKNNTVTKYEEQNKTTSKSNLDNIPKFITPDYKGRYLTGGKFAHGEFRVNKDGKIFKGNNTDEELVTLYFWNGVLLNDKDCFLFLVKLKKSFQYNTEADLYEDFASIIRYLSPDPFVDEDGYVFEVKNDKYVWIDSPFETDENGNNITYSSALNCKYSYLFGHNEFAFTNGEKTSTTFVYGDAYNKRNIDAYLDAMSASRYELASKIEELTYLFGL